MFRLHFKSLHNKHLHICTVHQKKTFAHVVQTLGLYLKGWLQLILDLLDATPGLATLVLHGDELAVSREIASLLQCHASRMRFQPATGARQAPPGSG